MSLSRQNDLITWKSLLWLVLAWLKRDLVKFRLLQSDPPISDPTIPISRFAIVPRSKSPCKTKYFSGQQMKILLLSSIFIGQIGD